jgi:AcrR family transcriptional regulator
MSRSKTDAAALLDAAQRAIHRLGPDVAMKEIAAEADVGERALLRSFGDRRGLAVALRDFVFVMRGEAPDPVGKRAARERISAFYPVQGELEPFCRLVVAWGTGFQMFVETNLHLYRFLRAQGVLPETWRGSGRTRCAG